MNRRIPPLFSLSAAHIGLCLLLGAGCVSERTYDAARTEVDQLTRALDTAQVDNHELEERVATLHQLNKQEEAALAEMRAAIRQDLDAAPIRRQRADDRLAALQTQVAHMINQNRLLGRELADAKQERVSLLASLAQHKQEVEEARSLPSPPAMTPDPQPGMTHRLTPAVQTPAIPTPAVATSAVPASAAPTPIPHSVATASAPSPPSIPVKAATASRPTKAVPEQPDESWAGMIKSWASSLWDWIFG